MVTKKILYLFLVVLLTVPLAIASFTPAYARVCDQEFPGSSCVWPYSPFYPDYIYQAPAYNIKFVGNWGDTDKKAVLQGVDAVGIVLSRHSSRSPQATFNCVFGETIFYYGGVSGGYSAMASAHDIFVTPGLATPRLTAHVRISVKAHSKTEHVAQ